MRKFLLLCLVLFCANLWAQEVRSGSREIEFFAQGGHSVAGGRGDTTIFNAGVRWGFGLFDLGRGSFEYELEAIPIYFVRQPLQNAYAISFTPFDVKYNFRRSAARAIPRITFDINTADPFFSAIRGDHRGLTSARTTLQGI